MKTFLARVWVQFWMLVLIVPAILLIAGVWTVASDQERDELRKELRKLTKATFF